MVQLIIRDDTKRKLDDLRREGESDDALIRRLIRTARGRRGRRTPGPIQGRATRGNVIDPSMGGRTPEAPPPTPPPDYLPVPNR